jgi:hypothetical protein
MKISKKQVEAVLSLPGEKRFKYFVKTIADREEVWGLYQNGWALAANEEGVEVFPLWPAQEYAEICAENEWGGYEPRSIDLNDFMEVLIPKLEADKVLPGVFYTPTSKGVIPSVDELRGAIEEELDNY